MKKKGERSREREVDKRPGNEGKVETRKWQQQRRLAAAGEAAAKPSGGSALRNQMTAAPKRLADRPAATEFEPPPAHPPSLPPPIVFAQLLPAYKNVPRQQHSLQPTTVN